MQWRIRMEAGYDALRFAQDSCVVVKINGSGWHTLMLDERR